MKHNRLVIAGNGEQGKIIKSIAEIVYSHIDFFDDDTEKKSLGKINEIPSFLSSVAGGADIFIAIGSNEVRHKVYKYLSGEKIKTISIIHQSAIIEKNILISDNVFIGPGSIIVENTTIGIGTYINSGCIIEHDNKIGNFTHLAPGVITGGGVIVGNNTFIGLGAILNDHIILGNNITIASGAVVTRSYSNDNILLAGVPAVIKKYE